VWEGERIGKGTRTLGITAVLDRLLQQALSQVLQPIFDPTFSDASFGFRPGRGTHRAIERAREHIASGRTWVVDLDLEKFFDRVTHDVLMARVAGLVELGAFLRTLGADRALAEAYGRLKSSKQVLYPMAAQLRMFIDLFLLGERKRSRVGLDQTG
jgi:RNA-directed DNA polymerase